MARPRQKTGSRGREVYVPVDSFITDVDGVRMSFVRDRTRVREGHPILARMPHLFQPIEVDYEWEQMTQAPGEQRGA